MIKRTLALTLAVAATKAWAFEAGQSIVAVPEQAFPDVIVIGNGWPANVRDGCLDRHECEAPRAGGKLEIQLVPGPSPSFSDIPKKTDGKAGP